MPNRRPAENSQQKRPQTIFESQSSYALPPEELFSIFYQSINSLQPKKKPERMMAVKRHGDKLFCLSPHGTLSSFDIPSRQVCWSIPTHIQLDLYQTSHNNCSYFFDSSSSSRVFKRTTETKPADYEFHPCEVFRQPLNFVDQDILLSKLGTHIYVDPVHGRHISPLTSHIDEILCIRAIHAQLTSYKPTNIVSWYQRFATFDIWILSREEGIRLQQHTQSRLSGGVNLDLLPPQNETPPALLWSSVIKNIDACKELSGVTRTSLGPTGTNKIVIKHQDKLFLNELEIQHPAAKLLVLAGKEQQKKFGDGTNLVVSIAGQHLKGAKELIAMGLNRSEIINGYRKASNKLGEILEGLVEEGSETMDVRDKDEVILRMKAPIASIYDYEDFLCPLIAEACIQACPENPLNFNVDNVRVAKLLGIGMSHSVTIKGMVLKAESAVGSIKRIGKAKVVVIASGVDTSATDTKASVLVYTDKQLESNAKTEEAKVEELIKAVAESGAEVIVSGTAVGEMALNICERYKIMVLVIASESELDCFRRTTNAFDLLNLGSIVDPCYLGYVDSIKFEETRGPRVTVTNEKGGVSTVLLGTTTNIIISEEFERAIDKGVNTYKALCTDSRIVPGAGATEIEIARKLKEYSLTKTGSDQNAIAKYAECFELIPKTLAENAYIDATDIVSTLYEEHTSGNVKVGIDLAEGACKDVSTLKIWDLYTTKYHALQYAVDAVCDVLGVDQI